MRFSTYLTTEHNHLNLALILIIISVFLLLYNGSVIKSLPTKTIQPLQLKIWKGHRSLGRSDGL